MRHFPPICPADTVPLKFYLAGQKVPAGAYLLVESRREVRLDQDDVLPATCDGHVAVYVRRPDTWADRTTHGKERS